MSTTSLFVEILVVGVQASIWLLLLLAAIAPNQDRTLQLLRDYKDYSALITTVVLSLIYALGIIVDRLADTFCNAFLYSKKERHQSRGIGKKRLRILHASESMAKFLDYQRSRIRIARATVFNLVALLIVGAFAIYKHHEDLPSFAILSYAAAFIALPLSILVVRRIDKAQQRRLDEAAEIIQEKAG